MKSSTLNHPTITRDVLLNKAKQTPGAWIGIRIAALLLILSGWKSSHVAELFGLTRWTVVKWIQKENRDGAEAVNDRARPGRPPQLNRDILRNLDEVLAKLPQEAGIPRARWDGNALVEFLENTYHIKIHVRHAQRIMKKLGYAPRRPVCR